MEGKVKDDVLLVDERKAAQMLAISPRKLWGLRASGEIAFCRIGRCIRYAIADLADWIEAKKTGGYSDGQ